MNSVNTICLTIIGIVFMAIPPIGLAILGIVILDQTRQQGGALKNSRQRRAEALGRQQAERWAYAQRYEQEQAKAVRNFVSL